MSRLRLFGSVVLAVGLGVLCLPATALAASDATSTNLVCSPSSVSTGSKTTGTTTCTATVTDTESTPVGAPSGPVAFTAAPSTGTFSGSGSCTLPSGGTGASSLCQMTFTPSAGGNYEISASYSGDGPPGGPGHEPSSNTGGLTAVDSTTTTLSCSPATVQINSSTQCSATLSDPTAAQPPLGTISFSSSPNTGTFSGSGVCLWKPSSSGIGGTATCQVTFTPPVAGPYTLTANYGGDSTHGPSSSQPLRLTATTTPAGGGPGSHGGGGGTLTIVISAGPPPRGKITIAPSAKVSRRHAAALALSCAGASGSSCVGALTFTRKAKVKVRVHIKTKHHSKKGHKGHKRHKTRIKIETRSTTIVVGSLTYSLATRRSQAFTFKLSRAAVKLLAKARGGRLKVQVWSAGAVVKTITLQGPKHKKHKRHHKHRRHKKK